MIDDIDVVAFIFEIVDQLSVFDSWLRTPGEITSAFFVGGENERNAAWFHLCDQIMRDPLLVIKRHHGLFNVIRVIFLRFRQIPSKWHASPFLY